MKLACFLFYNQKITELLRRNGILMGNLKTANYWPFMIMNIIGLSAFNLKIITYIQMTNDPMTTVFPSLNNE